MEVGEKFRFHVFIKKIIINDYLKKKIVSELIWFCFFIVGELLRRL